jgi:hypothetical protein
VRAVLDVWASDDGAATGIIVDASREHNVTAGRVTAGRLAPAYIADWLADRLGASALP